MLMMVQTNLGREVSELGMCPLCNGSQQVLPRMMPHDSIGIHHVGEGLGPQLQVGLIFGDPISEAVDRLLGKGLQQETDSDGVITDFGQSPDDDSQALPLNLY